VSRYLLGLIIAAALLLRVVGIGSRPVGFSQDEAGIAYDSYSLLLTGKDRWGEPWPLVLRSFDDYKLPAYSYFAIPSIAVFGLNEFATRFPGALFGTLAVIAVYAIVCELSKNKKLALLSSFFLATSPWHISLSRGAFEANLTTFFLPLGIWGFLKGLKQKKYMWIALISFGVNMFTYHSARLFTPLIALSLIYYFRKELFGKTFNVKSFWCKYWGVVVGSIALLILVSSTYFMGAGNRGLDVSIFNPTDKWAAVSSRRYEAMLLGMPDIISRAFSNKVTYASDRFTTNYLSYFSTNFLFTEGASEWTYGMIPGRGVLYLFEVITLSAALFSFLKGKGFKGMGFVLFWVLISPIPVALSKSVGLAATRAAVMVPAIQIISAWGLYVFYYWFVSKLKFLKSAFIVACMAIFILFFVAFVEDYLYHAPISGAQSMHYGVSEVINYAESVESDYTKIFISRSLAVPNIWVAFYGKWDPREYQKASDGWKKYQVEGYQYIDQISEYGMGNYKFGSIDIQKLRTEGKTLIVGRPEEFPHDIETIKVVDYPNGDSAYYFVESTSVK